MITTRLLAASEFYQYEAWLKAQDPETRAMYFGAPVGDYHIETLVTNIKTDAEHQTFRGIKLKNFNRDAMPTGFIS